MRPAAAYLPPLVIASRDAAGRLRRQAFLSSPIRLGRDPESELVFDAAHVSARHGLLEFDDREVWYTDLGSRNGTLLDGAPVAPRVRVRLAPGAELDVGPFHLAFERGSLPRPPEPPDPETIRPGTVTAMLLQLARTPDVEPGEAWSASLRPGVKVGRFELVRELGRGGFGVVFEALDQRLGRRVAFKAVRPGGAVGAAASDLLVREAEAAAQLCHPHIVQLFDAGTWDEAPFLIYELLRGEGLERRLERGPLAPAEALRAAIDVARALAHAHAAGVIHRDLKPSNVFATQDGWVKVLDFGLAHVLGWGGRVEGGTPRYMAPEQARRAEPDPRADVFSAAVILQETWLGPGLDGACCRAPAALPGAPAGLAPLLARALSEDPAHRPADGRAWLAELLALEPGDTRPAFSRSRGGS